MKSLIRLTAVLVALLVVATATSGSAAAAKTRTTAACKPTNLELVRTLGSTRAKLTWTKPRKAPPRARYRVYAGKAVIGQTGATSRRVNVTLGKRYRFKVRVLTRTGHATGCAATKLVSVDYQRPTAPEPLTVTDLGSGTVRLDWSASTRGETPLAGYRLYRDGALHQKPAGTSAEVRVTNGSTHWYEVAAIDSRGFSSVRTKPVTVDYNHRAPAAPTGLTAGDASDGAVTLSWSHPGAHIKGYRIFRDGQPVRQVSGSPARVESLRPGSTYAFTVAAVDDLGYVSAPSEALAVTTGTPEPTTGAAHAFLLASTDQSFKDFQAHYRSIGTVYPTFYDCNTSNAALVGKHDPLITGYAQARKIAVMPRFNCQRQAIVHKILTDPATRATWIDGIVAKVDEFGYDGINLDFEDGAYTDRGAYTAFVADLAARLHEKGKRLSLAVSAKTWDQPKHPRSTFFDYVALAQHADHIFVMAWGVHWATSAPGAQDELGWWRAVADYVATMPNKERFVMGMHLYAMDWVKAPKPGERASVYEYPEAIARAQAAGVTPVRDATVDAWHFKYMAEDGREHEVWFTDSSTQGTRVRLARERGLGGVGFWRLGTEDQRLWDDPLLAPGTAWR